MDRILTNLVEKYADEFSPKGNSNTEIFESFTAYSVLEREASVNVNPQDHLVAGGGDIGIDTAALIINGKPVISTEEVDSIKEISPDMRIGFVFIQTTTFTSINTKHLRNFGDGVRSIFEEEAIFSENEDIEHFRRLTNYVLENYAIESTQRPFCKLCYTYAGSYEEDQDVEAAKTLVLRDLKELDLFSKTEFEILDGSELQRIYNLANRGIEEEIKFPRCVLIPNLDNVSEAFVGAISAQEFLNIIRNEQGEIDGRVFFDNVRSFQGLNDVNEDILETIRDPNEKNNFPLLNNGVTLVSRTIERQRDKFKLTDYQIVNGCQTSYVINRAEKEGVEVDFQVPLKIVSAKDEYLVNQIIQATNNQTEVQKEELLALSDFQKELQDFYNSFPDDSDSRLFYERRSGEFDQKQDVENTRVISIRKQIKAFASVFLDKPHVAARYYGTLVERIGEDIFLERHSPWPYYASALCLYWLEFMARNNLMKRKFNKFRFHISHAFKVSFAGAETPRLNSKSIKSYSKNIIHNLSNRDIAVSNLEGVISELTSMDIDFDDRNEAKSAELVERVESQFSE
jgi:hypothetical protein